MERKFLVDAARIVSEMAEADGETIGDPALRTSFEAGYALLRAARQHSYELPFSDSGSYPTVVSQSRLERVSEALIERENDPERISQIYNLAMNIAAVNHPEFRGEERSEAGERLRDYKAVTRNALYKIREGQAVDFVNSYLFDNRKGTE